MVATEDMYGPPTTSSLLNMGAGPSNLPVPPPPQQATERREKSTALSDIAFLFIVPINVVIPVIYLMMPAFRAINSPEKQPSTKVLAISIFLTGFLVLGYIIPYFLFWLLVKAHQYKVIRLRRYDLMTYGINIL